jgi:hypothetical protein
MSAFIRHPRTGGAAKRQCENRIELTTRAQALVGRLESGDAAHDLDLHRAEALRRAGAIGRARGEDGASQGEACQARERDGALESGREGDASLARSADFSNRSCVRLQSHALVPPRPAPMWERHKSLNWGNDLRIKINALDCANIVHAVRNILLDWTLAFFINGCGLGPDKLAPWKRASCAGAPFEGKMAS